MLWVSTLPLPPQCPLYCRRINSDLVHDFLGWEFMCEEENDCQVVAESKTPNHLTLYPKLAHLPTAC